MIRSSRLDAHHDRRARGTRGAYHPTCAGVLAQAGRSGRVDVASIKRILLAASVGVAVGLSLPAAPAAASTVSTTPASWTPYLLSDPVDQVVEELEPCNGNMYAVGAMTAIGRGSATYTRSNAFSFSETTGQMTSWAPQINGRVRSIAFSPDCSTAYLGGTFTSVNGVAAAHLVAVDASTGAVKTGFAHNANGEVDTVRYTHGAVIIGGIFTTVNGVSRTRMASLAPSTGAVTSYLGLNITGTYPNTGATRVYNSQLSHTGNKLLIEGIFTSIAGQPRQQVAVLDLGSTSVGLNAWTSSELSQPCIVAWYTRAANWSPDDSKIYIATTGYKPPSGPGSVSSQPRAGLCDVVAAFPASAAAVRHTWINYTGCDSYYSVAADDSNVYVSGHERWANNAYGCDFAGPGALSRPGIASINPTTGLATSWNPTRSMGHGSHQLLVTSAGLWVASDTWKDGNAQKCGGVAKHGGICFLPY
jgi:hypothetical protein